MTVVDSRPSVRQLGFEPGLDGIRGVAILMVVVWHFGPDFRGHQLSWMPSGHLGVDLFFVLSGFLITALMLDEHSGAGRINFRGFYRRRAFRLLPALALFLAGHLLFAALVDVAPDPARLSPGITPVDEAASVIAVVFFASNWLWVFNSLWSTDFQFVEGMSHLWSLSVEEQFYLVWPGVTALLLARGPLAAYAIAFLTGSAVGVAGHFYVWAATRSSVRWMLSVAVVSIVTAVLVRVRLRHRDAWPLSVLATFVFAVLLYRNGRFDGPEVPFALYFDTFARADSLLVGGVLAHLWSRGWIPRRGPVALALLGWAVIIWSVSQRTLLDAYFYRYGWTVVALAAAFAIWGAVDASETAYGRLLSTRWLRAVGRVAYGLYLWHVLVFTVVRHTLDAQSVWLQSSVAIAATAAIVSLSWVWVEKPILARRYGADGFPRVATPE